MNSYQKCWAATKDKGSYTDRRSLVTKFSWAIPNEEAISLLVSLSPVVEMGAGTGYWAHLVQKAGGTIRAFDHTPPIRDRNTYAHDTQYCMVEDGGPALLNKLDRKWTLFLCWPPYNEPFAYNCLTWFVGNKLVYVGEGSYGCTGDEQFHNKLERDWEIKKTIHIPRWQGVYDSLTFYERKV